MYTVIKMLLYPKEKCIGTQWILGFYDTLLYSYIGVSVVCLFQHIRQQGKESMDVLSADAVAVKGFFEWLFKGNPVHTRFIRLFPLNHV